MRWVVLIVAAVTLSAATPARADTTIGALATPDNARTCSADGCTLAPTGAVAPSSGVITRWHVTAGLNTTPARLQVLRANAEVGHGRPP